MSSHCYDRSSNWGQRQDDHFSNWFVKMWMQSRKNEHCRPLLFLCLFIPQGPFEQSHCHPPLFFSWPQNSKGQSPGGGETVQHPHLICCLTMFILMLHQCPLPLERRQFLELHLKTQPLKLIKSHRNENCIYPWGWGHEGAFEGNCKCSIS